MFRKRAFGFMLAVLLLGGYASSEEGMYPINFLGGLNLRAKGLRIDARALYNPDSVGLADAVVKIGGCTGSFVSPEGLIITNHHCVFGYVQAASTKEHDYVTDGFLARNRPEELRALGATIKITESYRDVSREITGILFDTMEAPTRTRLIGERIRELVAEAEKQHPGKRAEVSEMMPGESYILFVSTLIRDVRIVYVPPRAIGEYGGEEDNWVWPRHTGNFSFVRAYVAPDGSPAAYAQNNVPYHPRAYMHVQPAGVGEGDAVFILGYPGRTYRHRTSHFMAYEEQVRMPYLSNLYSWQIATMEEFGAKDRAIALKFDARVKSLANAAKNYQGKLVGMKKLQLVESKRIEEDRLQHYILGDATRAKCYGALLQDIGGIYKEMGNAAPCEFVLDNLKSSSTLLTLAATLQGVQEEIRNAGGTHSGNSPDAVPDTASIRKSMDRLKEAVEGSLKNYYEPADRALLRDMMLRATRLPAGQRLTALDDILDIGKDTAKAVGSYLDQLYGGAKLADRDALLEVVNDSPEELVKTRDPFLDLAIALAPSYARLKDVRQARESRLSKLSADLLKVQRDFLKSDFIPDANSTLRFTCGQVRGYSPADGTYCSPITTLQGVMEKATGKEPFNPPAKLVQLYKAGQFGRFTLPNQNSVPVALLYDLDTTGGNSGSPLLNARGELVGVNFDRAFEATINDYAWSEDYSRSIAVDIRYVLWVTSEIGGAGFLLREMGVTTDKGT